MPFCSTRAAGPFQRDGKARMSLSLAAYSLRDYFLHSTHGQKRPSDARQISLFDFIDYCADLGLGGAELTGYYFPKELNNEFLLRIKRHAFLRGIEISGTAVGNRFTDADPEKRNQEVAHVKQWVDHAAVMGAPHIRVFAGGQGGLAIKQARHFCIEALEECCDYAGKKGVFLGMENHGGIVAEAGGLLEIVRAVKSPWLGINLDTGNFITDDPYGDIARCAPYAVNVQLKVEVRPRGQAKIPANLERLVNILRKANYQGYVALEYEASPDPWKTIPGYVERLQVLLG